MLDYLYIVATIALTVYGQIIVKWRVSFYGQLPTELFAKLKFVFVALFDPWIISGIVAAFLASLAWIAAMTKFELSYAYAFLSLNFIFIFLFSWLILSEPIAWQKAIGLSLIVLGTVAIARA